MQGPGRAAVLSRKLCFLFAWPWRLVPFGMTDAEEGGMKVESGVRLPESHLWQTDLTEPETVITVFVPPRRPTQPCEAVRF